jgi:DNA-binding YbaB/EbfC family protein
MDMQQLLAAAQQMQDQLISAQQELADTEVEGTAGGGLVTATVNGQGELVDLAISAAAIDVTDQAETAQSVADLVLAAVRDAYRAAGELQQEKMGPLAALSGGGPGEVPGLSEFFGGGAARGDDEPDGTG